MPPVAERRPESWLEPERTALQGLIQVAVAFHHLENGNLEGARSLLSLGLTKVAATRAALPLDARDWISELRATLDSLATGGGGPMRAPRWPAATRTS